MDKDIFTKQVLEAEQTMYRVAKSILIYDSDCEDAVSEAVLKAYSKLGTLREEKFFKTWLIRILINECSSIRRQRSRMVPLEETHAVPAERGEDRSEIYGAIMALKPKIRMVFVLRYIEGYSVEEIGKILKIPAGTVKSRLHCGITILKEELKNE